MPSIGSEEAPVLHLPSLSFSHFANKAETRVRTTLEPGSTPPKIKDANFISASRSFWQKVLGMRFFIWQRMRSVCGLLNLVRGSQHVHLRRNSVADWFLAHFGIDRMSLAAMEYKASYDASLKDCMSIGYSQHFRYCAQAMWFSSTLRVDKSPQWVACSS